MTVKKMDRVGHKLSNFLRPKSLNSILLKILTNKRFNLRSNLNQQCTKNCFEILHVYLPHRGDEGTVPL